MTADLQRRKELGAIHIARKQLALAEDSYRALVWRFSGETSDSAGALDTMQRRALLDHFRDLGFERRGAAAKAAAPAAKKGQSRRLDQRPQAAKARALWLSLWQLGALRDPSEHALGAFLQRHTGLEALQFADTEKLNIVIEHLKQWCARLGYTGSRVQGEDWDTALIFAQWDRLTALKAHRYGVFARVDTWMHREGFHASSPVFLDPEQKRQIIAKLGQWLRRVAIPMEDGDG